MKKLISLILSLALISSLIAGCTTAPETPEVKDETTADVEKAPETEEKPKPEVTPDIEVTPDVEPEPEPEPEIDLESIPFGTKVGERFNDLTLTDLSGNKLNTADLRGKIIIFNLWATWCPPCVAELPGFNEIAREYADDVVIVAVHVYDSAMYGMPSYVEENFPGTRIIFAYDTPYSDAYIAAGGTRYVPQTAIIDRNGVILYSDAGGLSHSWLVEFIESNK